MQLTDQQVAIVDAAARRHSFVVEAGAGTGKTSTMAQAAAAMGPTITGLYLAYNRAIVDDAAGAFPDTITCRTAHSLAYRAVGHQYASALKTGAIMGWQLAKAFGVRRWAHGTSKVSGPTLASLARKTIKNWSHGVDPVIDRRHVPATSNITDDARDSLVDAVVPVARRMWDVAVRPGQTMIRFDHDWYLRLFATSGPGGEAPQLPVDVVMFDECQDADPVIRYIFERQHHAQRIAVGDSQQAIYAWRGAVNAIAAFREAGAPMLPLTMSWRFGSAVAELANGWLDRLDAEIRLTGNPGIESTIGPVDTSQRHAVVCRTNAGVMESVLAQLEAGRKVAMVGCDTQVKGLAKALAGLHEGRETDHDGLVGFGSWDELTQYATGDDCDDVTLRNLVKLADRVGPAKLSAALSSCVKEGDADVVVTTAHKSKGRQWGQVKVHGDFVAKINQETGEAAELTPPDLRLGYVTVTRARQMLDPGVLAELVPVPTA